MKWLDRDQSAVRTSLGISREREKERIDEKLSEIVSRVNSIKHLNALNTKFTT